MKEYKDILENGFKDGLYLLAKYGLMILIIYFALQFGTQVISGSINGTQSALYLNELQNKGYLPKVVNGQVPPKDETQESKNEATSK